MVADVVRPVQGVRSAALVDPPVSYRDAVSQCDPADTVGLYAEVVGSLSFVPQLDGRGTVSFIHDPMVSHMGQLGKGLPMATRESHPEQSDRWSSNCRFSSHSSTV